MDSNAIFSSFASHASNSADSTLERESIPLAQAFSPKASLSAIANTFQGSLVSSFDNAKPPAEQAYGADAGSASVPVNYMNADLAAAYGMDSATAYQEALANTAHQREVKDLLAAGLNPVLSTGAGRGAAVFSGDSMMSGGYSSGGSSSAKSAFDGTSLIPVIAGLADFAISKNVGRAIKTASSAKGLMELLS